MPDLHYEKLHGLDDGLVICGIDEVGRGPLAGPVVAAAVILPREGLPHEIESRINDSKQLSDKKREALFPHLIATCLYATAECSVEEIDTLNIFQATMLAMQRATVSLSDKLETASTICPPPLEGEGRGGVHDENTNLLNARSSLFLHPSPNPSLKGRGADRANSTVSTKIDIALIDGNKAPKLSCKAIPIIKGDGKSLSIAAASIIAKVTRDRFMKELAKEHPGYGWEKNMGYGTAAHLAALKSLGPTVWHRQSFEPVAQLRMAV